MWQNGVVHLLEALHGPRKNHQGFQVNCTDKGNGKASVKTIPLILGANKMEFSRLHVSADSSMDFVILHTR